MRESGGEGGREVGGVPGHLGWRGRTPSSPQGVQFFSAQLQLHTYNTTAAPVFSVPILPGTLCVGYRSSAEINGGEKTVNASPRD